MHFKKIALIERTEYSTQPFYESRLAQQTYESEQWDKSQIVQLFAKSRWISSGRLKLMEFVSLQPT